MRFILPSAHRQYLMLDDFHVILLVEGVQKAFSCKMEVQE